MKFLQYILTIASFFIVGLTHAKQTGAKTTPTTPIVRQPQIYPQPKKIQPQVIVQSNAYSTNYKELLDYVRTLNQSDIFARNGFLTDDIVQFLDRARENLPYNLVEALFYAVVFKYMTWTGDFQKDEQKIKLIWKNTESRTTMEKPIIEEYQQ